MPTRPSRLSVLVLAPQGADLRSEWMGQVATQASRIRSEIVVVSAGALRERVPGVRTVLVPGAPAYRLLAAGVAAARGDVVTALTVGDVLGAGVLRALAATGGRPRVTVVARFVRRTTSVTRPRPVEDEILTDLHGVAAPTEVLREVGLDPSAGPAAAAVAIATLVSGDRVDLVRATGAGVFVVHVEDTAAATAVGTSVAAAAPSWAARAVRQVGTLPEDGHDRSGGGAARRSIAAALAPWVRHDSDVARAVSDALRASGAEPADVRPLSRGTAHDLAVLQVALPFADTSANVAARRVRDHGVRVDVVTADYTGIFAVDHSAEPLWDDLVDEVHTVTGAGDRVGAWAPTARYCRAGLDRVLAWEREKGVYRTVYSRSMYPAAHLLAARYRLRRPETRWRAEFSDPQVPGSQGRRRGSAGVVDRALVSELTGALRARGIAPPVDDTVWEWAEIATYAMADTVVFTNEAQREYMLGYCADPALVARVREVAEVSPHPSPPDEFYLGPPPELDLDPERAHVAYFGTFYATRSLTEVVAAFHTLERKVRERVRLHVFTNRPDTLRREVAEAGLGDVIAVNGYLDFASYLAATRCFDALLVSDYRTVGMHERNPYLPAKYADYRGSGRPIWGVVEPGSVLSSLPLDHCSDLGDVEGAGRVLTAIADAGRTLPRHPSGEQLRLGRLHES